MARLAAGVWVSAYLRRLEAEGIAAYITAKGDSTAGAVIVKLATMDGQAKAFHRSFDLTSGQRAWVVLVDGSEQDVDAALLRQRDFDPDLWLIEVENRAGRHMLDQPGFEV